MPHHNEKLSDRLRRLANERSLACWAPSHGEWMKAMRDAAEVIDSLERQLRLARGPQTRPEPADWMLQQ